MPGFSAGLMLSKTHTLILEVYQVEPAAGLLAPGETGITCLTGAIAVRLAVEIASTSYSGGTAPASHRLPLLPHYTGATVRPYSIVPEGWVYSPVPGVMPSWGIVCRATGAVNNRQMADP